MIEVTETISPITYSLGDSKLTVYPTESLQPACPFSTQSNLKTEMTINQIIDSQGQVITASDFIEIKSSPHHDNKIEIEVTDMFYDYKTLLDIKDFQEKLVKEFTKRNVIKLFRTKNVPKRVSLSSKV